jgi:predicted lipid-binding transport protein (Tim44 family)
MGVSGGFPIDLVLFGMIAAFLVLRLRSILGRREGFERPPETARPDAIPGNPLPREAQGPIIDGAAEPAASARTLPDPAGPIGHTLEKMRPIDRSFEPAHFLAGAESAFRMIVVAFATGNRDTLRSLLSDDTYRAFDAAITAREQRGETQKTDIKAIPSATIEHADLRGSLAAITVRFVSDQVNLTLDNAGHPVNGTDAVTEITDLWTFERDLATTDPTWRLVAARSA